MLNYVTLYLFYNLSLLIVLTIFMFFVCLFIPNAKAAEGNNNEYLYLSDIDYIESQSKAGWGAILKDQANAYNFK